MPQPLWSGSPTGEYFSDGRPVTKRYFCSFAWDETEPDGPDDLRPCGWESDERPEDRCPRCGYRAWIEDSSQNHTS
jgi:hypothetical protein